MVFLGILGKFLISAGCGVLLFVGWTLKGTEFFTQRQQDRLAAQFQQQAALDVKTKRGPGGAVYRSPPRSFAPAPGDPVFRLRIPAIGVDHVVVEGVDSESLKLGPGHYPECGERFPKPLCTELPEVWPGEQGRTIVSGHRTTYDAPFWGLDDLERGDDIITQTKWGTFTYEVTEKEVVLPNSTDIANPAASTLAEIALTTCNPKFSAAERLIVYGELRIT